MLTVVYSFVCWLAYICSGAYIGILFIHLWFQFSLHHLSGFGFGCVCVCVCVFLLSWNGLSSVMSLDSFITRGTNGGTFSTLFMITGARRLGQNCLLCACLLSHDAARLRMTA